MINSHQLWCCNQPTSERQPQGFGVPAFAARLPWCNAENGVPATGLALRSRASSPAAIKALVLHRYPTDPETSRLRWMLIRGPPPQLLRSLSFKMWDKRSGKLRNDFTGCQSTFNWLSFYIENIDFSSVESTFNWFFLKVTYMTAKD